MNTSLQKIQTIVVLGSGNVASHLARAFVENHLQVLQVYSRNQQHALSLAQSIGCSYTDSVDKLLEADLYLFALSDSAIIEVLKKRDWNNKFCVHTAGSVAMDIFQPFTSSYGVLYPFQTFSKHVELSIKEVPFFIEAVDAVTEQLLMNLAAQISTRVYQATSQQRLSLHLAGVFACNFVNHLIAIAEKILKENQLPVEILHPLITETIRKAILITAENAQTGPAIRNNREIIANHIRMLDQKPEWQKIYTFVSESIYNMYHS